MDRQSRGQPLRRVGVERSPGDLREVGYLVTLEHGFFLLKQPPLCVRLIEELDEGSE
jgi:hypothetical protein